MSLTNSHKKKLREFLINKRSDPATSQAVSCGPLTEEIRVRTQATPRENFGGPSGSGVGFSKGISTFSC